MRPPRISLLSAGVLALAFLAPGFLKGPAVSLFAQEWKQEWENKDVSEVDLQGVVRESRSGWLNRIAVKKGQPLTRDKFAQTAKDLADSGKFRDENIQIRVEPDPADPGHKVKVSITVAEYPIVTEVNFEGITAIPKNQVKPNLRINPGDPLNPYHLKQDRDYIRDQYLQKGYYFSSVKEDQTSTASGVTLTWTVMEGPQVSVEEIVFSGNASVPDSDLRRFMQTRENGSFLGLFTTGKEPFVERNLQEDIKRIRLYYQLEGWLDIEDGEHIFAKDLVFNADRTRVTVNIHIDEGERYTIRDLRFTFDKDDRRIFTEEDMKAWLVSKPGDFYSRNNADRDISRLREKYGERAYITAEITPQTIIAREGHELDLVYSIKENDKVYVGRLLIEGNYKTREDVIRREFTRTGFAPGEEFNRKSMTKAIGRIRDKGLIDAQTPSGGIDVRTPEGDEPHTRDVILDVKEGQTGTVRFAAGYSSSFGILGILEFTQRNFDIADLPAGFDDLLSGTGFAGGGQFLRIRLAPGARRQSYVVEFREPYVFGYEFGMGLRGYSTNTLRESFDEKRLGASVIFDKRLDPFTAQISLNGYNVEISNVDDTAPPAVKELEGQHTVTSVTPTLIYDTRSTGTGAFPYEGMKAQLSYEYAGQFMPGDFDFNKLGFDWDGYLTVFEVGEPNPLGERLKHILGAQFTFGWVHGARDTRDVPLFERYFAGGRNSIRGFQFRGMGPHENGDPVGGEAYVFGSLEYSFPLFVEILRGAVFYDVANLAPKIDRLDPATWRTSVGFGIRFVIPQLGSIPVALDFGFPLHKDDGDDRQTVTFDIGQLF